MAVENFAEEQFNGIDVIIKIFNKRRNFLGINKFSIHYKWSSLPCKPNLK